MKLKCLSLAMLGTLPVLAFGQWDDVKRIGTGGETYVSTDGEGTVYISSHLPVQAFVSRNWGDSFGNAHPFPDSLGDMVVYARPKGKAIVTYMHPTGKGGMASFATSDYGQTWKQGTGIPDRKLDREWVATDEKSGAAYMIYSDGYIGGPRSKGIFVSKSEDDGLTWKELGRVDKEAPGDFPVDPHLVNSSDGKLYALWTTSKDYDHVDAYKCAVSTDGGVTWTNHTTLGTVTTTVNGKNMDNQERWMLGGLAAHGEKELLAFFVNYMPIDVYGDKKGCLVSLVRYSHDAGKTWSEPQTILNERELKKAATAYYDKRTSGDNFPDYIQCLTWACYDAAGHPHFVWQDDRDGQTMLDLKAFNRWHIRHTWSNKPGDPCVDSERVSKSVTCKRPPLDFICAAADSKYLYVTWTETPKATGGFDFSGEFWFGRKKLDDALDQLTSSN